MARSNGGKAKAFFRTTPSGAFDQYLQDIQKLPLIKDPAEERRLARRVQRGDEKAAERLVTANLRFVISYVKKYQGHGLDLSELVAIGRSEEHTSELQSLAYLVCRLLLEKKKKKNSCTTQALTTIVRAHSYSPKIPDTPPYAVH